MAYCLLTTLLATPKANKTTVRENAKIEIHHRVISYDLLDTLLLGYST